MLALASSPVIGLVIVVLLLAMLGGGIALGFRVVRARPVTSPRAIKGVFGWPVLASVSPLRSGFARPPMMNGDDGASAYRRLQLALGSERPLRSILITSAAPGRASSILAGDLAYFISAQGMRTLLLDAQLAHPSQDQRFGVAAEPGLTDAARVLAMEGPVGVDVTRFMLAASTVDAPQLRIVPAGAPPPDVSAALGSRSLGQAVDLLATSGADVIIIDAPPITAESGAVALASRADGVLVVVESGRTRQGDLTRLRRLLLGAQARVLGCIIAADRQSPQRTNTSSANERSRGLPRAAHVAARR